MKNNRIFALCYRSIAFILCLAGILKTLGIFDGAFSPKILLYYTTDSNVLVLAVFAILLVRTAISVRRDGSRGNSSYNERLSAIIALAITVTLLVFWGLLAPQISGPEFKLLSYMNLQIHTITPILMVLDYFLFAEPGKLKKIDPIIFALIPLAYFALTTIAGFSGVVYGVSETGVPVRFPYFFVDFDALGSSVFLYVGAITIFFIGLAYLFLFIDKRRAGKRI
jgi:hypothetical protein